MDMIIYVDVLNPLTPKIVLEILPSGSYTYPPKWSRLHHLANIDVAVLGV